MLMLAMYVVGYQATGVMVIGYLGVAFVGGDQLGATIAGGYLATGVMDVGYRVDAFVDGNYYHYIR
jgi:hypothetical protein